MRCGRFVLELITLDIDFDSEFDWICFSFFSLILISGREFREMLKKNTNDRSISVVSFFSLAGQFKFVSKILEI
jgi:hypothetical protein